MTEDSVHRASNVLRSGFIGQGQVVDAFEEEFGKLAPHPVVAMNSCTSSIHAVLTYLGVGPGDEVITTPLTCIATNAPILAVGARPVWADVDWTTGNINVYDVLSKITDRTKAIIAVNWTGRPADYQSLREFGLPVIEDAAHGPIIGDRDHGDFICYSFGPIKHLTCGDGGAVSTADPTAREALRLLRWYGLDRTSSKDFRCAQNITLPGMKFHMNDINAAIGLGNVHRLPEIVRQHKANARLLHERLKYKWKLMPFSEESNYWVFPILTENWAQREALKYHLETCGVMASQVHARNDHHDAYRFPSGPLPGLQEFDECQLNIPCGWWLDEHDAEKIIDAMFSFNK
jgi:dTDP-4-amino-4,6-dideoxygalactose transaminase